MTENLFVKLEERMMVLLSEVEELRQQVQRLTIENATYRTEKETNTNKLQDLLSLLDSVNAVDNSLLHANTVSAKPVLVQGMD